MKVLIGGFVGLVLSLGTVGAANANIMFDLAASGTGDNVLFDNGLTGTSIVGTSQSSNTNVMFTGNETLATQANGQAKITGSADQNLNFIDISLQQANSGFTSLVFNINGLPQQTGSATVTVTDQFGNTFSTTILSLSSGQNFVTVTATNGEFITDVKVTSTADFNTIQQVRLGGAQAVAVPGPIAGAGLPALFAACGALALFARRRRVSNSGFLGA